MTHYKNNSLWFDTLEETIHCRPALLESRPVDVAIIGAGYTGLWTAYYLKKQQPDLSIAIVEAETAGYGASGRNGGWLMGSFSGDEKYLNTLPPPERGAARDIITHTIDEVAQVLVREDIDCDFHHGGNIQAAARYPEQRGALQQQLKHLYQQGHTEADYRWLNQQELEQQVRMRNGYGAIYTPHCASINPAKLVRGLARAVEKLGVTIYEKSPVTAFGNQQVTTTGGSLQARIIVPALEAYQRPPLSRFTLPVYSLIVATEPLSAAQWADIGLEQRPTFCDTSRLVTYGQRSADGRLVFGARGGYQFGSKVRSTFNLADKEFRLRESIMRDLFPSLREVDISHGWGGALAMARAFAPHAIFDRTHGVALAGGYGGEGVGASNLFARTLTDLILEKESALTRLPWAFRADPARVLRRWEPEPFRWLTYQTLLAVFNWEDQLYGSATAAQWKKTVAGRFAGALEKILQ